MKRNMQERALFDAVTNIDEDLIAEAASPRVLTFPKHIRRITAIAAALAILITAIAFLHDDNGSQDLGFIIMPGVIKVYAYDMVGEELEDMEKFELTDGGTVSSGTANLLVSVASFNYLPLTFEIDSSQFEDAEIQITMNLNYGSFWRKNEEPITPETRGEYDYYLPLGREFTFQNGETIFWSLYDGREETYRDVIARDGGLFADVIIYADGHPVGYMVIEIVEDIVLCFYSRLLESRCFPKVDGQFQNVTEEDIQKFIAQAK